MHGDYVNIDSENTACCNPFEDNIIAYYDVLLIILKVEFFTAKVKTRFVYYSLFLEVPRLVHQMY